MRSAMLSLLALASLAGALSAEAQVSGPASGLPAYYSASSSINCGTTACSSVTLTPVIQGDYTVWWLDAYTDDPAYQVTSACDSGAAVNSPCSVDVVQVGQPADSTTKLYVEYAICPTAYFSIQAGSPTCSGPDLTWLMVSVNPPAPYVTTVYGPGYVAYSPPPPENPHWVPSGFSDCQGTGSWVFDAWTPGSGCGQVTQTRNATCSGSGTQTQTVTCQDVTATVIDDSYCTDPKPATTQSCALGAAACGGAPQTSRVFSLTDACTNSGNGSSPGDGSSAGGDPGSGGTTSGGGSGSSGGTDGTGANGPGVNLPGCVPSATTFCVVVPASR